ncbi:MAG: tRNA (adenosine(37)-N6)-threonylcarbamoyltransferase complex ATPase subunit type 1 TsaE [Clostridia bacterium]|nr:tRNA (adenosine(37)-N6)-threonylcarbamoyltransferase complex ATPase subunit type 1 TsaE [Clostridia bacterium]
MFSEFISNSPDETEKISENFALTLNAGSVIAFIGGLGVGKTCFMRGLARGLGFNGEVTSPTFSIVNEYRGGRLPIFHYDMYRISTFDDLYSTGYFDYLNENGIIAIEWSENISEVLENDTIFVNISVIDDEKRKISIFTKGKNE